MVIILVKHITLNWQGVVAGTYLDVRGPTEHSVRIANAFTVTSFDEPPSLVSEVNCVNNTVIVKWKKGEWRGQFYDIIAEAGYTLTDIGRQGRCYVEQFRVSSGDR